MKNANDSSIFPDSFNHGLSKREHFAALALSGLVANEYRVNDRAESLAKISVQLADALLKELKE